MTRYCLELAKKHRKILYEQLEFTEYWLARYQEEAKTLQADKERLEQRIIEINKFIEEEERLDGQSSREG